MNLFTFIKKKEKNGKVQEIEPLKKQPKQKNSRIVLEQMETEFEGFGKKANHHHEEELPREQY